MLTMPNVSSTLQALAMDPVEAYLHSMSVLRSDERAALYSQRLHRELAGYSALEVLGQNVKLLVPQLIRHDHDRLVNANRETGVDKIVGSSREVLIERKDGGKVWGSLSLSKVQQGKSITYTAFVRDITTEHTARESIRQTLEQALDAVVSIDEHNLITFFNAAAERLWGYARSEVLGQNIKMLVPKDIQGSHDGYVNANRHTGQDKIVGTSRDVPIFRKDGSQLWGNLSLSKVEIEGRITYTAFVKDITKERQVREALNQTLEQALDAVVSIDPDNNVTFFNAAAERLWGYERREVLGHNEKMLVPQMIQSQHDELVNANRRTGVDKIVGTSREVCIERKDGSKVWAGGSFRTASNAQSSIDIVRFRPGNVDFRPMRTWTSPHSGARYPVQWRVLTPVGEFEVRALLDNQELDSSGSSGAIYWEGLSDLLDGSGQPVGRGYLEMTGYAKPLRL